MLTAVEDYEDFSKTNQVVQMVVKGKDLLPFLSHISEPTRPY